MSRTPSRPTQLPESDAASPTCPEETQRREAQRAKQIAFGINTDGYKNMMLLVEHDPRLRNGGVLPIPPPPSNSSGTKRAWDFLVRRWRRALHMYDHVYIDGVTTDRSLEEVIAAQESEWRSKEHEGKTERVRFSDEELLSVRNSEKVPATIPIDSSLIHLLRSKDKYDAFAETCMEQMVASASGAAATLAQAASPTTWGLKFVVGPDGSAVCPSVAQAARGAQPSRTGWRSASRSPTNEDQLPPHSRSTSPCSPDVAAPPSPTAALFGNAEMSAPTSPTMREGTVPTTVTPAQTQHQMESTPDRAVPDFALLQSLQNVPLFAPSPSQARMAPKSADDKKAWRQKHQYQKPSSPSPSSSTSPAHPKEAVRPTVFRVNAPPFIPKSLQQPQDQTN